MTITYRIRCDACQSDRLFGQPHLIVGLRPNYPGCSRDLHFCDTTCLQRHVGNLTGMLDDHIRAFRAHGAKLKAERGA